MAAPVIAAVSTGGAESGGVSTANVTAPTGSVAGQLLVAITFMDIDGGANTSMTATGWTLAGAYGSPAAGSFHSKVWWRLSSGAATYAFGLAASFPLTVTILRITGADNSNPFNVPPTFSSSASASTSQSSPSITPAAAEVLEIRGWTGVQNYSTSSYTPPVGYTEAADFASPGGWQRTSVAWRNYTSPGVATGTKSATETLSGKYTGLAFALASGVVPFSATDTATGDDVVDVDKTQKRDLVETGTGVDVGTVFSVSAPVADAGFAIERITIDDLVDIPATDSGTGSETVSTNLFLNQVPTDSATGVETATVSKTLFVPLTETGTAADVETVLQMRAYTETAVGTDVVSGVRRSTTIAESGTGVDEITIIEIPFTQVLAARVQVIYDLVVVARVPNASGPPALVEVDPIEWKSISYSDTLSAPQELTATAQLSSVTEPVLQRLRALHELATELWLYRDGKIVFAGPLVGWQTSGETLTLKCQGLQYYLRLMGFNSDIRYVNNDQASVVAHMVNSWQVLEYGNFGIDTTAAGLNGVGVTVTYLRNELKNVGTEIEKLSKSAAGFDVEVDPTSRQLRIWTPTKGVDRSEGEDAIVIDSRNITSSDVMCSVALGDLASDAYGTGSSTGGDTTLWSAWYNATTRAHYGRSVVTQSFSDVSLQQTLDDYVEGLLTARGVALLVPGPKVRVTPDADLRDYNVGDTVSYELGGALGVSGAFRIRKMTVSVTSTGSEAVDLEFV